MGSLGSVFLFLVLTGSGSSSHSSDPAPGGEWQRNHHTPFQSGSPAFFSSEILAHGPEHPSTLTRHVITKADEELFLSGDGKYQKMRQQSQFS